MLRPSELKSVTPWLLACLLTLSTPALAGPPPSLMLATVWEEGADPGGWWLSEKYDGVRGYWDGAQMVTRGGEPVAMPAAFRVQLPPFALDGELWAGRGRFAYTLATVRDREPGPGWSGIRYRVFDAPTQDGAFAARLAVVQSWLAKHPAEQVMLAEQVRCWGRTHLKNFLQAIERKGGEGVMLRAAGSPYEPGRSTHLRKYKSFQDTEATVLGYNPGKGKYTGKVGSLRVALPDGTRFAVGSGLTDADRANPPPIGSTITFKHNGWTRHGKPRFPVFWRVREMVAE